MSDDGLWVFANARFNACFFFFVLVSAVSRSCSRTPETQRSQTLRHNSNDPRYISTYIIACRSFVFRPQTPPHLIDPTAYVTPVGTRVRGRDDLLSLNYKPEFSVSARKPSSSIRSFVFRRLSVVWALDPQCVVSVLLFCGFVSSFLLDLKATKRYRHV